MGVRERNMEENVGERKTEDGFCHLDRGSVPNLFTWEITVTKGQLPAGLHNLLTN